MAEVHGSDTVVIFNGTDISIFCKTTDNTDTKEAHDVTTYSPVKRKRYKMGLGDGTFTEGGTYDNSAVTSPNTVIRPVKDAGTLVTFEIRPEGTGVGLPFERVSVGVTSYKQSHPVDDIVSWEAEFQKSGAITYGTQ